MRRPLLIAIVSLSLGLAWWGVAERGRDSLVVYCAHDLVYSEQVLRDFEQREGIRVNIVADTEATKSLSLVERILAERRNPQCDVFWNNEVLGTIDLAQADALEAYIGSGHKRIPGEFKDQSGLWTGFAGRLRVWILNPEAVSTTEASVTEYLQRTDLSRLVIAKPLYGTTLTQYSVDWHARGAEAVQSQHATWVSRGCHIVAGNATSKDLVAKGLCDLGLTDTDDYFTAVDAHQPVAMLPVRIQGRTVCIPNSVAVVRGTKRQAAARKLVDYLLSAEVELRLSKSGSRQIPLGTLSPAEAANLDDDVRLLQPLVQQSWSLSEVSEAYRACRAWLKSELAR